MKNVKEIEREIERQRRHIENFKKIIADEKKHAVELANAGEIDHIAQCAKRIDNYVEKAMNAHEIIDLLEWVIED